MHTDERHYRHERYLEETDLDEDQSELTAIIRGSGRDLQTIIGNVLLVSQLEADRVALDDSPFNLRRTLEQAIKLYASLAANKDFILKLTIDPSIPTRLAGDKVRLAQIMTALLDNAVKFTEKGAIAISARGNFEADGTTAIAISVTDAGIGIAPEDQARIFERFTQKDGSTKLLHGGTGLGLTVARDLAERMGGTLELDSKPEVGSSLTLRLKLGVAQEGESGILMAAE